MPNFFLVLDLVVFGPGVVFFLSGVANPKNSLAIFLLSPLQPLHYVDGP